MVSQQRHSSSAGDAQGSIRDEPRRTLTLRELRPLALIGQSIPLFQWSSRRIPNLKIYQNKKMREYYKQQNKVIDALEVVDDLLDTGIHASLIEEYGDDIGEESPRQRQSQPKSLRGSRPRHSSFINNGDLERSIALEQEDIEDTDSRAVQFWINLNMAVNVLLLLGKIFIFLVTDSLSIVASLVDSVLDLLSTVIIYVSANFADRRDWKTKQFYPVGRYRLEPIGVLVFSVIMIVSFVKIAQEALGSLLTSGYLSPVDLGLPSLIIMIFTISIKGVLWYLCKNVDSSSVQALSQDAITDCVFNTFSILFPLLSQLTGWGELDPLGALVLAIYVVWSWGSTAMGHINNLTGAACSPEERQQLLYLCTRFSERIKYVTALNAYHAGDRLMCEVDVLLDPELSMKDSHDLAEALQYALETLTIVERAFVHIDYRRDNFSGHVE